MMNPEFPARFYTKGDEPEPQGKIKYHSKMNLLSKLEKALHRDEWEYLCNSPLGVFIKFYKLEFHWAWKLVHHMLTSQLVCGQKYEIWCLIGAKPVRFSLHEFEYLTGLNCDYIEDNEDPQTEVTAEMKRFWNKLGLRVEHGPSVDKLIAACGACESWTRDERLKLGYLSIYASFIDAHKHGSPTRVGMARLVMDVAAFERYPWGRVAFKKLITSVKKAELTKCSYALEGFVQVLQVWIYYALPEFGAEYGQPIIADPIRDILSYKGRRYRNCLKAALLEQKRVQNFFVKESGEYEEMFPLWDDEEDDEKIHNIVKAFHKKFGDWTFTSAHWSDVGVKSSEVVKVPNKKRRIDHLGEESRKKETLDSSEEVVGTLTVAADRDATNFKTWKQNLRILTKRLEALEQKKGANVEAIRALTKRVEALEQKEGANVEVTRTLTKRVEALEQKEGATVEVTRTLTKTVEEALELINKEQKEEATVAADRESTNMASIQQKVEQGLD